MTERPASRRPEVLPVFPTPVCRFRVPPADAEQINAQVRATAAEIVGNLGESGDLLQTHQTLHLDAAYGHTCEIIRQAAGAVMEFMQYQRHPFEITGLWVNVGRPGAPHKAHSHPNNFLSGTYYAVTPEGASAITFHDPRPQAGLIAPQPERLTPMNGGKITFDVAPGDLLLWPSWLRHSVPPNRSGEDRLTLSFNLMFSAFTERHSPPMKQKVVDALPGERE